MTIDDQIRNEKLQYDISRETAKVSALSSKKIYKYEYLTDKEILQFNQKKNRISSIYLFTFRKNF